MSRSAAVVNLPELKLFITQENQSMAAILTTMADTEQTLSGPIPAQKLFRTTTATAGRVAATAALAHHKTTVSKS